MITFTVFNPMDLAAMDVQADQVEARMPYHERITRGEQLASTGRSFTVRRESDRALLLCAGALQSHGDLATLWAIFSETAIHDRRAMVAMRDATRRFLKQLPHRRVDTLVRSDHRAAHNFVHALGMDVEARLNDYFPDGGDAVVYRLPRRA